MENCVVFWFRRDLRLDDNHGLYQALKKGKPVLGLFIFDTEILNKLPNKADARVEFIHNQLITLNKELLAFGSSLCVKIGNPIEEWIKLTQEFSIKEVHTNSDYEPYALERDKEITKALGLEGIPFHSWKDQVIFEKSEVTKEDGNPYTVFTPYKRKWMERLKADSFQAFPVLDLLKSGQGRMVQNLAFHLPLLSSLGFERTGIIFPERNYVPVLKNYAEQRNFPSIQGTSRISVHLRFGTLSIRELARKGMDLSEVWLSELIWREFYFSILWHFPRVTQESFRKEYDSIPWRNSEPDFEKWCQGKTGYPLVDAGMRELNATGFMHNRVRMVVASFLTKHLLIDWRWGEAYFAEKLLDFELSSNNGGWQWAAGSGVDAAPYFRIFNPYEQEKKFDPDHSYIKKWVKEWNTGSYPLPIVEHKFARARCLDTYQKVLGKSKME